MLHIWIFGDKTHRGKGGGGKYNKKKNVICLEFYTQKPKKRGAKGARHNKTK
jgi:hypothetical protein